VLASDFALHGAAAIEKVRNEKNRVLSRLDRRM
jgi:hypothetical protein